MDDLPTIPQPTFSDLVKQQVAGGYVGGSPNFSLMKNPYDSGAELAIIKGLGYKEYLKEIWMQVNGYDFDYMLDKWVKKTDPLMNEAGIRNLMSVLNLALRMDFSNIKEDDIPKLTMHFFRTNFPQFVVYNKEFGLDSKNVNIISTACWLTFYIAARNAKGAGHRNTIRGTLSEQFLGKIAEPQQKEGFFKRLMGMRRKR